MQRRRTLALAAVPLLGYAALPARAALAVGAAAPAFTADAALGGKPFRFDLAAALREGPVVLYFFPKAFTSGCTVEANLFAETSDRFAALKTKVIGMSNDDIETLKRFSVEACRDRFAVAADAGGEVTRRYDAAHAFVPGIADRISYLIAPDARIAAAHDGSAPEAHVTGMLEAAGRLQASPPPKR